MTNSRTRLPWRIGNPSLREQPRKFKPCNIFGGVTRAKIALPPTIFCTVALFPGRARWLHHKGETTQKRKAPQRGLSWLKLSKLDFHLPAAACSYRVAVVSIRKQYPGHARRVMMGVWSYLRQFTYTKFVIVTDDDIDVRDWSQVIWALSTRVDPARDSLLVENTPIDYLDFSSPTPNLGSKLGLDATHKWPAETNRSWSKPIQPDPVVEKRVEALWQEVMAG